MVPVRAIEDGVGHSRYCWLRAGSNRDRRFRRNRRVEHGRIEVRRRRVRILEERRRLVVRAAPAHAIVLRGRAPDDVVDLSRWCPTRCCRRFGRAPDDVVVAPANAVPQTMLRSRRRRTCVPQTMLSASPRAPDDVVAIAGTVPHTMLSLVRERAPHDVRRAGRACPRRCCRRRALVPHTMLSPMASPSAPQTVESFQALPFGRMIAARSR